MTTYYPAFICYTMSFLIIYPAATGAGSWCKKCCKAHAFYPHKMEISSQSVPLQLLNMGFPGKKTSKARLFRTVVFKGGCVNFTTQFHPVESKSLPDCGSSLQILIPSAACLGEERIKIDC